MMFDHVHMCILVPPEYSVAQVIGCIKGRNAIAHGASTAEPSEKSIGTMLFLYSAIKTSFSRLDNIRRPSKKALPFSFK
jgi:REP element-mobilizing transposase RayT